MDGVHCSMRFRHRSSLRRRIRYQVSRGHYYRPSEKLLINWEPSRRLWVNDPSSSPLYLLVCRRAFLADPRAKLLEQAFRRAWIEILFKKDGLRQASDAIVGCQDFAFQILNEGGLFSAAA